MGAGWCAGLVAGTSLTAIEASKIIRPLDVLVAGSAVQGHVQLDPHRIACIGLSYGGYYALVAPALEPRIAVSVCSCYAFVQELRYREDELSVPSDFRFPDRFTLFREPEVCALICPRALQIQAGVSDTYTHRDPALAPATAAYWERVGSDRFEYKRFEGGHEWNDESGWAFVERHL